MTHYSLRIAHLSAAGKFLDRPLSQSGLSYHRRRERHRPGDGAPAERARRTPGAVGHPGVIHCAGILRTGRFEQIDLDTHQRLIEINLFGAVNVAQASLPNLRDTRGSLILMSSTSSFVGTPEFNRC